MVADTALYYGIAPTSTYLRIKPKFGVHVAVASTYLATGLKILSVVTPIGAMQQIMWGVQIIIDWLLSSITCQNTSTSNQISFMLKQCMPKTVSQAEKVHA